MKILVVSLLLLSSCGAYVKGVYIRLDEAGIGTTESLQSVVTKDQSVEDRKPDPFATKATTYKQVYQEPIKE